MDQHDIINDEIFEELLKESRKATKEDVQLIEQLETLVRHPGWGPYVVQVLGKRIQDIGELILQPAGSTSGMVRTEYIKGVMYGLCLARDLPSVIIASMKDIHPLRENTDDDTV